MFDFLAGMIALYVLFWIFVIAICIVILLFIIRLIVAIVEGVRSPKPTSKSSVSNNYEKSSMTMEANDIKYIISEKAATKKTEQKTATDNAKEKDNYILVSVEFTEGGKRYDYIAEDGDVKVGDTVIVDVKGSRKSVRVVGVNIRKADELELPLSKYKHILTDGQVEDTGSVIETEEDIPEDAEVTYEFDSDEENEEGKELTLEEMEEEERIYEPYICPECFEPYDGIYCENCGHSNDVPGEEELSDDDKFAEHFAAAWMFDQMDKEAHEKNNNIFGSEFGDDFDEDEI